MRPRCRVMVGGVGMAMAMAMATACQDAHAEVGEKRKEDGGPEKSLAATAYWNIPRHGEQYVTGIVGANIGALRLETRVNYEARRAMSAFVGWTFAGGEALTYSATPIVGWVGGDVRGPIGGLEASLAWRKFDYYIEIEYVHDQRERESSYVYAWSELAYRPADWLRLGLAVQRTRAYQSDRDIQRGPFAQVTFKRVTAGVYWFNPASSEQVVVVSMGISF